MKYALIGSLLLLSSCAAVEGLGKSVGDLATAAGAGDAAGVGAALTTVEDDVDAIAKAVEDGALDPTDAGIASAAAILAGGLGWWAGRKKKPAA